MTPDELFNTTWGNYLRVCYGEIKRSQNLTRHTRLILGGLTGKDPRELIPLPGDYEHLIPMTRQQIIERLEKMGMKAWLS
jgi:hypothetical protein